MDDDEDVEEEVRHAEEVRVVGARVAAVEEFLHAAELEEAVEADVGALGADQKVEEVGGRQRQHVEVKGAGRDVAAAKAAGVTDHETLLQVT